MGQKSLSLSLRSSQYRYAINRFRAPISPPLLAPVRTPPPGEYSADDAVADGMWLSLGSDPSEGGARLRNVAPSKTMIWEDEPYRSVESASWRYRYDGKKRRRMVDATGIEPVTPSV